MRPHAPLLVAVVCLAVSAAIVGPLDGLRRWSPSGTMGPAVSGLDQIRLIAAEVLYLQMDDYHHIMMYQGYDWTAIADYLPQIWLIVKLKPDFWQAYEDGAYHLAVNLGMQEEGMRLLEEGLENCPGNRQLLWQNVVIRWHLEIGTVRERLSACAQYARALRRGGLPDPSPTEMRNVSLIGSWVSEHGPGRVDSLTSRHYSRRADILDSVISAYGLTSS